MRPIRNLPNDILVDILTKVSNNDIVNYVVWKKKKRKIKETIKIIVMQVRTTSSSFRRNRNYNFRSI